jgi:Amt family ammonium transporter
VLGVMMQCIFLIGLMTIIWGLYGYSLAFGGTPGQPGYSPYIGNSEYLFMQNVQRQYDAATNSVVTPMFNAGLAWQIPMLTHMLFQGMFFIITPALIVGAFAERMKFSTMVVFMILWGTFVYCPLCHWVTISLERWLKRAATCTALRSATTSMR